MTSTLCFALMLLVAARLAGWAAPPLARSERLAVALATAPSLLAAAGAAASLATGVSAPALIVATLVPAAIAALLPSAPAAPAIPSSRRQRIAIAGGAATVATGLAIAYRRSLLVLPSGELSTGTANNLGDLPFHLGLTHLFAYAGNLPPTSPQLAGADLAYPFLPDLGSALLLRGGWPVGPALWVPGLCSAFGLCWTLHHWTRRATGSLGAALVAPLLPLLAGGVEWAALPGLARRYGSFTAAVGELYSGFEPWGIVWKNPLLSLLVPQRATASGLPLVVAVLLLLWVAADGDRTARRSLAAAGLLTGLLPLTFPHGLLALAICLPAALATAAGRSSGRWGAFLLPAVAVAAPQLAWLARAMAGRPSPLAWQPGWMASAAGLPGISGALLFWLLNLGPLLPLAAAALLLHRRIVLRRPSWWASAWGVWGLAALVRLAPWAWDNTKVLLVFATLAAVPVAALLAALGRRGGWARGTAALLLGAQCASGLLVVAWSLGWEPAQRQYPATAVRVAAEIRHLTPPDAVLLEAPDHAPITYLAGRRLAVGYPGHLWSHGLDGEATLAVAESFYRALSGPVSEPRWQSLLRRLHRHGVTHVLVGPREGARYGASAAALGGRCRLLLERHGIHLFELPAAGPGGWRTAGPPRLEADAGRPPVG